MRKFLVLLLIGILYSPLLAAGPDCAQIPNLACADGSVSPQNISTSPVYQAGIFPTLSNFGAAFTASDTNPTCSAGEYKIYSDLSETKLKKCQNGTVSDLAPAGGGTTWDAITDPGAAQTLSMGAFVTTWTWGSSTGAATDMFVVKDTASNTGTGYVAHFQTAASSSAKPLAVTAGGTANGFEVTTAGLLQKIGTGSVRADDVVCTTCVGTTDLADNAITGAKIDLASNATGDMMYYNGTDWVRVPAGTSSQLIHGGSTPAFSAITNADIGPGDLASVLVWNETAGGTWPNKTLANSPRSVDTALIYNNGLIYTRVASCTTNVNEYTLSGTTLTMCDSTDHGAVKALYEM